MNVHRLFLMITSILLLLCVGCTPEAASVLSTSTPTVEATRTAVPTNTIVAPSATTVLPSLTPLPSITPTDLPTIHQTYIEIVASDAVTGDGGNNWGGHQTRIVHTKDGVFTAYTVKGSDDLNREWRLTKRQDDGTWMAIAEGESGREPVNLLASPDGTLTIIGWPKGRATIWTGKPEGNTLVMTSARIPNQLNGNWPYNSAGIGTNGNLCVLSSEGGETPGGQFFIACYILSEGRWITKTSNLDYRFCYTYVFPFSDGGLSLVSTRDVRWEALRYQKPSGGFDYVYNAFGVWQTDSLANKPLQRIYQQEEKPTLQYPAVILNAQDDAYLDTKGRMHVIYHIQGESTNNTWQYRHAIISSNGSILSDLPLPDLSGNFSRIFQDAKERYYLLGSSGILYTMDQDGIQVGKYYPIRLSGNPVEYSGFGLSVPRTGTPLSMTMDVVFPSADGSKWIYFQLDFSDL